MSQSYPPPYQPHQPYQAQHPATPPKKPRPRGHWFVWPILLMVLGIGVFVGGFVVFGKAMFHTDAAVAQDGQPHEITLDGTEKRMLWASDGEPAGACTVTDTETGEDLAVSPPGGTFTRSSNGPQQRGVGTFEPSSTAVTVTCGDVGSDIEIGRSPGADAFAPMLVGILGGLGLGTVGFIWLVVLLILFASRPPRSA